MRPVEAVAEAAEGPQEAERPALTSAEFDAIYDQHVDFVWRNLRRLGVPAAQVDDACQDVFLVLHRRKDFAGRSTIRTWLFGIVLRVASEHRRKSHRAAAFDALADHRRGPPPGPFKLTPKREAARLLDRFLGALSDAPRPVFTLAELEKMPAPQIAGALDLNLTPVSPGLRLARRAF